jgi:hypothetical protein
MKVVLTADHINGEQSRITKQPIYTDELDSMSLVMMLTKPGVVSITITAADMLQQLKRQQDKD